MFKCDQLLICSLFLPAFQCKIFQNLYRHRELLNTCHTGGHIMFPWAVTAGTAAPRKNEIKARSCILIITFDTDTLAYPLAGISFNNLRNANCEFMLVCFPEIKDMTGHIIVCHQSCESTYAFSYESVLHVAGCPKMFDNVFHGEPGPGYVRARQKGPSWMKPKCILSSNQYFIHGSHFRLATTIGCSRTDKAALVSGVPRPILLSWSQQQLCQTSTKKEKEPLWCTTEKGSWKRWVGCSEQHTPRTICWLVTVWHFSLMWSIKHTKLLLHSSHR